MYAYIRRKGHNVDEASDLTQEFFTRLLSGSFLERATPETRIPPHRRSFLSLR